MSLGIAFSDIIALIALGLSGYAIWTTSKFNKRQLSLMETQDQLNRRQLEQGESEALQARRADVGANLVKMGRNNYRLKVFNRGKAPARDIRIEFPDGNDMIPESELRHKFPMEVLEQHQSVDLIAAPDMGTPPKQTAILRWVDDHSESNEKTVYLTL
jgi:hypothetical protein